MTSSIVLKDGGHHPLPRTKGIRGVSRAGVCVQPLRLGCIARSELSLGDKPHSNRGFRVVQQLGTLPRPCRTHGSRRSHASRSFPGSCVASDSHTWLAKLDTRVDVPAKLPFTRGLESDGRPDCRVLPVRRRNSRVRFLLPFGKAAVRSPRKERYRRLVARWESPCYHLRSVESGGHHLESQARNVGPRYHNRSDSPHCC